MHLLRKKCPTREEEILKFIFFVDTFYLIILLPLLFSNSFHFQVGFFLLVFTDMTSLQNVTMLSKFSYGPSLWQFDKNLCILFSDFVNRLIQRALHLDAIRYIYAFDLIDKFPPASLLKGYFSHVKEVCKDVRREGRNSREAQVFFPPLFLNRFFLIQEVYIKIKVNPDNSGD